MERILIGIGHIKAEKILTESLQGKYHILDPTVSTEGVYERAMAVQPEIIIVREGLTGKRNILDLVYSLVNELDNVRIILLAGDRKVGDPVLATLVNLGVYDVLYGGKTNISEIINLVENPNQRKDVAYLQPKPKLDESLNEISFVSPDKEKVVIKNHIKEIFVPINRTNPKANARKESEKTEELIKKEEKTEEDVSLKKEKEIAVKLAHSKQEEMERIKKEKQVKREEQLLQKRLEVERIKKEKQIEKEVERKRKEEQEELRRTQEKQRELEAQQKKELEEEKSLNKESKLKKLFQQSSEKTTKYVRENGKMIAFVGARHGVGTTTLSIGLAANLAKNHKVLYVELNDINPSSPILYEISKVSSGIETALQGILAKDFSKVEEAILTNEEHGKSIEDQDSLSKKSRKKYPKGLNFLTFSKEYVSQMNSSFSKTKEVVEKEIRELFFYLNYQTDYDYIILDVMPDYLDKKTFDAIVYSSKIFYVLNQDIVSIFNTDRQIHELNKIGLKILPKTTFLVNRYHKDFLTLKEIQDWICSDRLISLPDDPKLAFYTSFKSLPLSLYPLSIAWRKVWAAIEKEL